MPHGSRLQARQAAHVAIERARRAGDPIDELFELSDSALLRCVDAKADPSPLELHLADRLRMALEALADLEAATR
jgi:hypothetical protein